MSQLAKRNLVEEKLNPGKNLIYALQHVFAMVAGAVAVPIIIGNQANLNSEIGYLISCTLFSAGIATLIQSLGLGKFMGAKIPIIEATSFASVNTMAVIAAQGASMNDGTQGLRIIAGGVIAAGIFCFLMAGVWSKLLKFFPDVVTGTVVTVIGLSLFPIGIKWIANNSSPSWTILDPAPIANIGLAFATLLLILLCNKFLKGILGNLSILFGLVGGTILSILVNMADFSSVAQAKWFGLIKPFQYGLPIFEFEKVSAMILVMFVIMTEASGNIIAVHQMSGKKLEKENLARGLRASGFSTVFSGIFHSYPVTPYSQNVGMLSLTGVYSRFVTATSGVVLLLLAFFPKFAAIFSSIPKPVLGGAGFAMFGIVAVSGLRTLGKVNFVGNKNAVIVAVSLGLSLIPTVVPNFFNLMPDWAASLLHSGITIGCLSAIILNILFNMILVPKNNK